MTTNETINNAVNAESTRVDGPAAGETEASMASVAAGKAKLAEMLAGSKSKPSAPSAPPVNPEYQRELDEKKAAQAERVAKTPASEKRRQELSRPDNPD